MGSPQAVEPGPTILVDADACPVPVRIHLEKRARRHQLRLIFFTDDSHDLHPGYGEVKLVAGGQDAVDYVLIRFVQPGDIVVTQDYGLAALVLSRSALAIHPGGKVYTRHNIDQLLMERHLASRARRAGERLPSSKKRSRKQDVKFADQLDDLIRQSIQAAKSDRLRHDPADSSKSASNQ